MPPARKPRIFISHSAKEAEAQEVRDKLKQALKATDQYETLLDVETLKPGDPWRNRINLWLGACDAAIVLLSEKALASHYVTYETSVLAFRSAAFDTSLLILPVLIGDVTPEKLQASYLSPAQLDEKQLVRGTPDEIVAKVLTRLGEVCLCETTPVEKRARKLAHQLRDIPVDILQDAADALQLPLPLATDKPQLFLALKLLSVGMPLATPALLAMHDYIPPADRAERMSTMIELVASSWVDLRCVGRIPGIAKGKEPVRAFGLNATRWDAARMYVISARHGDLVPWYDVSCTGIFGEDVEELVEEIRGALVKRLMPEGDLLKELKALGQTGQPVIVGLDGNGMDDKVLTRLRDEFPHVTFFLMTGEAPPLSPTFAEQLFPPLLEGDEKSFLEQYEIFEPAVRYRPKRG